MQKSMIPDLTAQAEAKGFRVEGFIEENIFYSHDLLRSRIYHGTFHSEEHGTQPAVLKVYDDPRPMDEPAALKAFHDVNTSTILAAPKLYYGHMETPKSGFLIMERLPDDTTRMNPQSIDDWVTLANLYHEYRRVFPKTPHRPLMAVEHLSGSMFHLVRLGYWFARASEKEFGMPLGEQLLTGEKYVLIVQSAMTFVHNSFKTGYGAMEWCHGHFKHNHIYKVGERFYLTGFSHVKMYPLGYELAFIIWADHFMADPWNRTGYDKWREEFQRILTVLGPMIMNTLPQGQQHNLMRRSLMERLVGTMLADVILCDKSHEEKHARFYLCGRMLEELLSPTKWKKLLAPIE